LGSQHYLIGIDIGTSGTKTAIFDSHGFLIAESFIESSLYYPEKGAIEQNLDEIYYSVVNTVKECLEKSKIDPLNIEGISIDGQMAGICGIDKDWNAVTPYDSWLDTRCAGYINNFKEIERDVIKFSGGPLTYSHGPKMLWLKDKRPDVFKKVVKFVMPAAYVSGRIANLKAENAFIDYTYIHFSNFADIIKSRWSDTLLDNFNFLRDKLPLIIKPHDIIGKISKKFALQTGLASGVPIAAGCGDQAANILVAGINKPGMIFDVAGTASVFSVCTEKYVPDEENKTLFTAKTVFDDLWYAIAYVNGGGLNIRWFRDEIIKEKNCTLSLIGTNEYNAYDKLASEIEPGSGDLFFIPHMNGSVCPINPNLKGAFIGLTWRHKKQNLYRALLESIAYEYAIYLNIERSLVPKMEMSEARVIGGGSKSKLWNQIKADVLGIPYLKLKREEFGTLGSAIIAGFATGVIKDMKEAADNFNEIYYKLEPDKEKQKIYNKYSCIYLQLLSKTERLFNELEHSFVYFS